MAEPIDTSKLGPIKVDSEACPWARPEECAADLRWIADDAVPDGSGNAVISKAKLRALARIIETGDWEQDRIDHIASGWRA